MIPLTTTLLEGTTGLYSFVIEDDAGEAIDVSRIGTLTLTAYDWHTQQVINTRQGQNVFNGHDVIIVTDPGPPVTTLVTWTLQPLDTIILTPGLRLEVHEAYFTWTWDSGTRTGVHGPIRYGIENLPFVA